MKQRITWAGISVLLGIFMIAGLLLPLNSVAAPPAAPTPISNVVASDAGNYFLVVNEADIAADSYYEAPSSLAGFEWADWQYAIDQGSTVNTTTLTIEYSNDGSNWATGPALVSSNAADADDLTRLPLFGRYARIYANVTNTETVTISVNLLAK